MKQPEEIFEYLKTRFNEAITEMACGDIGQPWILVDSSRIKDVSKFLRDDQKMLFDTLMCLSGVHYPKEEKLGVTYHLYSTEMNHKIALKVKIPEGNPRVPSVESVWKTADWHEREAWDMVGVVFDGHPHHERILCPDDWEGHPLRKDYAPQEFYRGITTGD